MRSPTVNFILTAVAYIIPTMILGMVWHFLLFKELYEQLAIYNRAEPIIPLGFTSMIIQGVILAYFYPFYSKGKSTLRTAITYNLMMGLFLFSVSTLANGAKIHVTSMQSWLFVQLAFHFVQFLVSGVLIGLVNNNQKK